MSDLAKRIVDRIATEGPITFETFMTMALYEPGLGYYMRPGAHIGQAADFYTATNVHALFGVLLARQALQMWELLERPRRFTVLEQGPGRGLFARDFLDAVRADHPAFYEGLRYVLVEKSGSLCRRQADLLGGHGDRVTWLPDLASTDPLTGLFFSNELVDAFPVHLVEAASDGLGEIYVDVDAAGGLTEKKGPLSDPAIAAFFEDRGLRLPSGYRTELNLNAARWLSDVARVLYRGWVVTVDYGFSAEDYYSPERSTGTLLCYHRHETNEAPLERPGQQDITAHVDFSALVRWGRAVGLEPVGFTSQSSWLLNLGVDRELEKLFRRLPEKDYLETAARVRTLLMPDAMGESHKVLVQGRKAPDARLHGLSRRNVIDRLRD